MTNIWSKVVFLPHLICEHEECEASNKMSGFFGLGQGLKPKVSIKKIYRDEWDGATKIPVTEKFSVENQYIPVYIKAFPPPPHPEKNSLLRI